MEPITENKIVLIIRQTRLDELISRFNTLGQAKFYVEHLGADFSDYQREDETYKSAIRRTEGHLRHLGRVQKEKELRMGYVEPGSMRLKDFMEDSLAKTGDQIRESTRIDYREAMEDFIDVLGNMDYQSIQQTHGEFFRQTCLDRGDSPATIAKKLRGLKRFFCLAVQRKQLDENPLQYVKLPKVPRQRIRIYTPEEINRILRAASQFQNPDVLEWDLMITLGNNNRHAKK